MKNKKEEYKEISLKELDKMGYIIKEGDNPKLFWKPRQIHYYHIVKKTENSIGLNQSQYNIICTRTNIIIQKDISNKRIRLKGENVLAAQDLRIDAGVSDWVYYEEPKNKTEKLERDIYMINNMLNKVFDELKEKLESYEEINQRLDKIEEKSARINNNLANHEHREGKVVIVNEIETYYEEDDVEL